MEIRAFMCDCGVKHISIVISGERGTQINRMQTGISDISPSSLSSPVFPFTTADSSFSICDLELLFIMPTFLWMTIHVVLIMVLIHRVIPQGFHFKPHNQTEVPWRFLGSNLVEILWLRYCGNSSRMSQEVTVVQY